MRKDGSFIAKVAVIAAFSLATTPALANVLQVIRDSLLQEEPREKIAAQRLVCATGEMADSTARLVSAGFNTLSTGAYCITVLTRAGRDGTLHYVSLKSGETTPSIAFDTGFVSAYLKHDALPADLPAMATVLPVADRCLSRREPNSRLCGMIGQVLGARAALGELVPVN